jgi:hypothetical protein
MARTKVTVGELAAEAGIEDGLALMRLREAGLDVRDSMSELPKNRNSLARKVLNLGGPTSSRDVASLASRAGEDEEVVRVGPFVLQGRVTVGDRCSRLI